MAETSFAEVMKANRKLAGVSQRELARATGIDQAKISLLENGLPPSLPQARALTDALGLQPSEVAACTPYSHADLVTPDETEMPAQNVLALLEKVLIRGHWQPEARRALLSLAALTNPGALVLSTDDPFDAMMLHVWDTLVQAAIVSPTDSAAWERVREAGRAWGEAVGSGMREMHDPAGSPDANVISLVDRANAAVTYATRVPAALGGEYSRTAWEERVRERLINFLLGRVEDAPEYEPGSDPMDLRP